MEIRRLFIESAAIEPAELRHAQRVVSSVLKSTGLTYPKEVFDEFTDFAWEDNAAEAWEAVKRCDEIYGDTSLTPLSGYGTYTGAPVVMDVMMKKAIEEKIENKSLFLLREFDSIDWDEIDSDLLLKCFQKNKLFTTHYDEENTRYIFRQVDVSLFAKK